VAVSAVGSRERARTRLASWTLWLGVIPLVGLAVLGLLGLDVSLGTQYLVLVVGSLVVGLPHGALDCAALPLGRRGRLASADVALVGLLYLVLGGGYLVTWVAAPLLAAVGFLLLTWLHWGQGDAYVLRAFYGAEYVRGPVGTTLAVVVRGGIPMVVPLIADPATYRRVLDTFVGPFGGDVAAWGLFAPSLRVALGAGLAVVSLVALGRGWLASEAAGPWRLDGLETLGLWLFFLTVPPILAIGVYFACWHSIRHVARVVLLDEPSVGAVAGGRWGLALARVAVAAAVPTLGALVLVGGIWLVAPNPPSGLPGLAGLGLVGIAVLTLPHVAIVTWLDRLDR
jgi:Brp/Blh family beta-carotene 15,15'-monooxygenase